MLSRITIFEKKPNNFTTSSLQARLPVPTTAGSPGEHDRTASGRLRWTGGVPRDGSHVQAQSIAGRCDAPDPQSIIAIDGEPLLPVPSTAEYRYTVLSDAICYAMC